MSALEAAFPYLQRRLTPERLREDLRTFVDDILDLAETEDERASARTRLSRLQAQLDAGAGDGPARR